ncbi:MAG: MarR family transcriptional regulator [Chloroflexi bacterium]|nr:MAG: MarR family transcriptional regulator [Chloroflexota bacterium]
MRVEHPETDTVPYVTSAFCPRYHHAVELIGRRWTGAIVRVLLSGALRFSDIAEAVPGLSDRLLSERLKELEAEEIVIRTVIPATPVRVEYRLTEKGRALAPVVEAVSVWAETWGRELPHPEPDCPPAQSPCDDRTGGCGY